MPSTTLNLFDTDSEGSNIGPHSCNWANNSRTLPLLRVLLCNPGWPRICYVSYNCLRFMVDGSPPCFCLWSAEMGTIMPS